MVAGGVRRSALLDRLAGKHYDIIGITLDAPASRKRQDIPVFDMMSNFADDDSDNQA